MAGAQRADVTFRSGGSWCAAWLYTPQGESPAGSCVVMGHGLSLTRHDGLTAYADALQAAGAAVLVFDYRHFGDSPGQPRQRFRRKLQVEDWRSAIAHARRLPGVDPTRIVAWGFSFAAWHLRRVMLNDEPLAAAILLCPFIDGWARVRSLPPALNAWIAAQGVLSMLGRAVTVPVTAAPGQRAAMPLVGEAEGFARTVSPGSPWRNAISPESFLTLALHRPVASARRWTTPVWVGLAEHDHTASADAAERLATDACEATLRRYPGGHFGVFDPQAAEGIARDQIDWLGRLGIL